MPLNEDNEFNIDITNSSIAFSTFNANNQTNNEQSNNNNVINMVIIGGIAVISCSILSGLIYLYYQNHMLPQASDSLMETTTSPFVDVTINDGASDISDFYGEKKEYKDDV